MIINFLALIPARKGSKRIKGKNLVKLAGKPLIQYTIESSKNSKRVDKILLSSNDPKILKLGKKFSLNYILKRPEKNSKDRSSMEDVVMQTLKYLKKYKITINNLVLLQPTTPFRSSKDIDAMISYYKKKRLSHCVSVSNPFTNSLEIFHSKSNSINLTQNNKYKSHKHLFLNGSIYIFRVKDFLKNKKIYPSKVNYFIQGLNNSIDINNEVDLELAKSLLKKIKNYEIKY